MKVCMFLFALMGVGFLFIGFDTGAQQWSVVSIVGAICLIVALSLLNAC